MSKLQERNVANERVYTVEEIAREARISRTAAYELVKKGLFPVIRVGSSIRIPKKPFDAWLDGRGDYAKPNLRGVEQSLRSETAQQLGLDAVQLLLHLQANPELAAVLKGLLNTNLFG